MMVVPKLDPRITRELQAPPPRQVKPRPGRWGRTYGVGLFVLLFLLVGVGVLAFLICDPVWLACSAPIPARITSLSIGHFRGVHYVVEYAYVWDGRTIGDYQNISAATYQQLHVGETIKVHTLTVWGYHFSETDISWRNYVADHDSLWPVAILFIGISAFIFRTLFVPRRLVRDGHAVVGKIVDKQITSGKRSDIHEISYEYIPQTIGSADTSTGHMKISSEDYDKAMTGQEVSVLYDPVRPNRSVVYEFADFAAVR
jgi:hypothetical protein